MGRTSYIAAGPSGKKQGRKIVPRPQPEDAAGPRFAQRATRPSPRSADLQRPRRVCTKCGASGARPL
eukprot:5532595-Alexandrium_andersonii.AAC.2